MKGVGAVLILTLSSMSVVALASDDGKGNLSSSCDGTATFVYVPPGGCRSTEIPCGLPADAEVQGRVFRWEWGTRNKMMQRKTGKSCCIGQGRRGFGSVESGFARDSKLRLSFE
jgi:hypothetical protein